MPVPQKVSGDQIKAALVEWKGNVSAAAQDLKISTNNLRKRMAALGVDLAAYRNGRPNLPLAVSPVRTARKPVPVRLKATHEAVLQDARFDFQHVMRQELTAGDVLAMLLDEELAGWVKRKLEALREAPAKP